MRVEVHTDWCIGSGVCALVAPDVFDQRDDDGIVVLLDERPAEALHGVVREAASVCPGVAISVSEEG
jgi:ferredoxin